MKSRFTGRKVMAKMFLAEALRGERNFTDCDLSGCDLAAHPQHVERFNQMMVDRCVPPDDPSYPDLVRGNWLELEHNVLRYTLEKNRRAFEPERFYFTQANLSGFIAIGMWFPMVDLRYTYLDSADLTECFLCGALFDDADAPSVHMENADVRDASFCGARFLRANMAGSLLQGSRMLQANFVNSSFVGANLNGAVMENTDMTGCDFAKASLMEVEGLSSTNWSGASFKKTLARREDIEIIKRKRELDGLDTTTPEHRALRKGK